MSSIGTAEDSNMSSDNNTNANDLAKKSPARRVTMEEGIEADDNAVRRPFVSRHRVTMDRIKTDASEARPYQVPAAPAAFRRRTASSVEGSVDATADPMDAMNSNNNPNNNNQYNQNTRPIAKILSDKITRQWKERPNGHEEIFESFFPCWRWLRTYNLRETLWSDVIAGLTVGVMVIPQSMSYAKLAGLPVEFGLYSALVPVFAYSIFGSSRQLAVGPVALVSLLLNTGLTQVMAAEGLEIGDPAYQPRYNTLAIQTSFLVGISYILMGLLRLGFVTIFLSHAVISGFTTGAAVIIGLSQVKHIVGYEIKSSKNLHHLVKALADNIEQFNVKTFSMGMVAILCLVGLKNVGKRYAKLSWMRALGPLLVTTVSIVLVVTLDLQDRGIPIVGTIPKGLPSFTVDQWTPVDTGGGGGGQLTLVVVSIVIVGFMESIAIAKQLASKHKYEIDASQELIGLGMANFLGAMFQAYPVTGSFSRSAVNNEGGAKSGVSGMVTATLVGLVLLFLTVVFEKLPLCVLAAIVISGVLGLLDYPEAIYLFKVHKFDFLVWLTACMGTMFLGVETGLAIAVGVSLLIVVYESAYPHTSVLGRLPGTAHYRNVKQYADAEIYDGMVMMRIDAPLYFANAQNVRDKIRKYRLQAEARAETDGTHDVKYLVLEMGPVSHVDTSALHILEDMHVNYKSRNQQLIFCNPSLAVMERLVQSGLADRIGQQHFFPSVHDAVQYCLKTMDVEACSLHESVHGEDASDEEANITEHVGDSTSLSRPATTSLSDQDSEP